MKKIIILFLTVMSLQIFGANYRVTGKKFSRMSLQKGQEGMKNWKKHIPV